MSKLAHSHQPTMDEIERQHMRENGFSEEEILAAQLAEPLPPAPTALLPLPPKPPHPKG